ncbi:MAG: glutamate--tRNA ligase [Candidatus Altiarchaeales archaeon]|nr:MAG: glutamate--tRNA ligase [Candidatus Altiarchaeales archaeon]HDO82009.1 glutamate--tRNA ligase [Candidatus Altiarchaeales archaeon]HEX54658.1 glutamate--tRNA ligase [Candidatus Altiarchaeales archaeon]
MSIEDSIRRHAIENRLRYGKASEKAIIGKVLAEFPEERADIQNLIERIRAVVKEVNDLGEEDLKLYEKRRKGRKRKLELKLPRRVRNVVMRFAPNPNGPATLGSARGIVVNYELARKYNGRFILRFDDTDPKTKKPMPRAYEWYLEDCKWLGAKPDEVYYASDRIPIYYRYAEKLIKLGKAYVCFCSRERFKSLKDKKIECQDRNRSIEKNLELWNNMLSNKYEEGECVLRIKTDMKHKDPALRDWVAFRIIKEEHPRVKDRFIVWPTLDFESAIEDHILGITHIIRGKDLMDSEKRQRFIYEYLGWEYPVTLHWGRIKIKEFGKFSTSKLKKDIENGKYFGWDDPRIPTLLALRRRGISAEAIRNLIISLGINENDISISMENLFAENRKVLDPIANRYFFVPNPRKIIVKNAKSLSIRIPLHPSFRERGYREFHIRDNGRDEIELFIPGDDANELKEGDEIRLMNLFNIRIEEIDKEIIAKKLEEKNLKAKKVQWVQDYIEGKVVMPTKIIRGYLEPLCNSLRVGDIVQFERFGFSKLDERDNVLVFYFAHR